jgi:flagellar hook assembly protein FlgD
MRIQIFDITGKQVRVLVDAHQRVGVYTITWDGRDDQGRFCASGVYFSKLSLSPEKGGESQSITKKLVLAR